MKPAQFAYAAPTSLDEALSLLTERGDEAKLLAGGQSLVPLLNMRLAMPDVICDINRVPGLDRIEFGDHLTVGPLVRQAQIERSVDIKAQYPLLAEAIGWVGHRQIRNRGTVLGSLAHGDPAAELPLVYLAMDGEMEIARPGERRVVSAGDFFVHIMETAVAPDEMLVSAQIPRVAANTGSCFMEVARRHGDFAVASVAVLLTVDHGVCTKARIAMGGVAPVPLRAIRAEESLLGAEPGRLLFIQAGELAAKEPEPASDIHGSSEYRSDLIRTLVQRALSKAAERVSSENAEQESARDTRNISQSASNGPLITGQEVVRSVGTGACETVEAGETVRIVVHVNGEQRSEAVPNRLLLSDFIRTQLRLTGTHVGCEHGVCGCCTVLMDGQAVRSCLLLAVQADGHEIRTVESLGDQATLHPLQSAFRQEHGLQCGFCTGGILMTLLPFLEENSSPSDMEIREALSGNLCRCTGYVNIVKAVQRYVGDQSS